MWRRLLVALGLLAAISLPAAARERVSGWCEQGGNKTTTGGLTSTEYVQESFPSCTITVYDTGTLDIADIFSDDSGTVKANPFTASDKGFWFWYADDARYDIRFSGGGIATPFTIGDILLDDTKNDITTIVSVASSATPTFDASLGTIFTNTLTANVTSSTISNAVTGQRIVIYLAQDGTGGWTFVWPGDVQLRGGGYVVSDDVSAVSTIKLYYDGTNWREIGWDADEVGRDLVATTTGGNLGNSTVPWGSIVVDEQNEVRVVNANGRFATIQAAHDDLPAAGGVIVAPEGTEALGGTTLTISKDNVTLIGAGSDVTFVTSTRTSGASIAVTGHNIKIIGITFEGPCTAFPCAGNTANGLHWNNTVPGAAGRPQMEDVLVHQFGAIGIFLDSTTGPGNLDLGRFTNVRSQDNASDGWKTVGTDVNGNAFINTDASSNVGWGYNIETFGNTFVSAHGDNNGAGCGEPPGGCADNQAFRFEGDRNSGTIWIEDSNAGNLTFTANSEDNFIQNLSGLGPGAVSDSGTNNWFRHDRQNPDASVDMQLNQFRVSRTGAEALRVISNSPQVLLLGDTNKDAGLKLESSITGVSTPIKTLSTSTNDLTISNDAGSVIFKQEDAGKIILDEAISPHLDITANNPQVLLTGKTDVDAAIQLTSGQSAATTPSKFIGTATDNFIVSANSGATILLLTDVGDVRVRRYKTNGTALVAGDFALHANWGTTATVDNVVGDDQKFRFRVNSSGTGQGATPTVTFTFTDGTWTNAPIAVCNRLGGDQLSVPITMGSTTATTVLIVFNGTPVAAETYSFVCIVMGDA